MNLINHNKLRILKEFIDEIFSDHIQCITDHEFRILHCTDSYLGLFDIQGQEVLGKRLRELNNQYTKNLRQAIGHYMELLKKNRPKYVWVLIVLELKTGKKSFWIEVRSIEDVGFQFIFNEIHFGIINDIILQINRVLNKKIPKKHIRMDKISLQFTELEELIIFLLAVGKSHKQISLILSKTFSKTYSDLQIKRYIHNKILDKFNVLNVEDLVEIYLLNSRLSAIPNKIISLLPSGVLSITPFGGSVPVGG